MNPAIIESFLVYVRAQVPPGMQAVPDGARVDKRGERLSLVIDFHLEPAVTIEDVNEAARQAHREIAKRQEQYLLDNMRTRED